MLTILARIKVNPDAVPRFLAALPALTAATRAEAGCCLYEFNQSNDDPSLFLVYEKWADQAALDRHVQTPHISTFVGDFGSAFSEPLSMTALTTLA